VRSFSTTFLGGGPQDEDPVPELLVGDGAPFAFLAWDS
jgi:hypothetical protein